VDQISEFIDLWRYELLDGDLVAKGGKSLPQILFRRYAAAR
jgi:hypothetical protein